MQLGEWINTYRTEHGLSMQAFADLCGFSKAYIGQLEKGINPKTQKRISPTMQTFSKIAKGTGLTVDELLGILDDNQPISIGRSPSPAAPASRPHAPAYNKTPALSEKDEREISRDLEDMIHTLDGAAAMGQAEDDEDQELLRASLHQAMLLSKRIARKKYTPKKYRDKE